MIQVENMLIRETYIVFILFHSKKSLTLNCNINKFEVCVPKSIAQCVTPLYALRTAITSHNTGVPE